MHLATLCVRAQSSGALLLLGSLSGKERRAFCSPCLARCPGAAGEEAPWPGCMQPEAASLLCSAHTACIWRVWAWPIAIATPNGRGNALIFDPAPRVLPATQVKKNTNFVLFFKSLYVYLFTLMALLEGPTGFFGRRRRERVGRGAGKVASRPRRHGNARKAALPASGGKRNPKRRRGEAEPESHHSEKERESVPTRQRHAAGKLPEKT